MQITSYAELYSLVFLGLGSIVVFWSVFSYAFVKAKEFGTNPSRVMSNISFLVLSTFWSIFLTWIYVMTL